MKNARYDIIGDAGGVVFTAIQSNELFQIISLVLTILSIVISIIFTIYQWYNLAKKDGKITQEEIKDVIDQVKDKIDNNIKK